MLTLKAGTWSRDNIVRRSGFTLFELLVVIAILSSIVLVVFPKLPVFEGFMLDSEARRVAGLLRYLDESASAKKLYYRVWFRPEEESFRVESSIDGIEFKAMKDAYLKGYAFRSGISIEDLVVAGLGRVQTGEVSIVFNPGRGAPPFTMHLSKGPHNLSISYNPYSGKVTILEGYV
jgi:prepilin-type N-terminal cleavage/methylation domain-containing protein